MSSYCRQILDMIAVFPNVLLLTSEKNKETSEVFSIKSKKNVVRWKEVEQAVVDSTIPHGFCGCGF